MATVQNTLGLKDGMSPVLQSIIQSMQSTMAVMASLDAASTAMFSNIGGSAQIAVGSIDGITDQISDVNANLMSLENASTSSFDTLIDSVVDTTYSVEQLTTEIQDVNQATQNILTTGFDQLNTSIQDVVDQMATVETASDNAADAVEGSAKRMNDGYNGLGRTLRRTVATLYSIKAVVQGLAGVVGISDEFTRTTARLDMINDGLQTTKELQDSIYLSAQRARTAYSATADFVAKVSQNAKGVFDSNEETIAFAETLNKMYGLAGSSQRDMLSANTQLLQALGSGVLRGQEFNAVFNAAPNIMQAVADYMDVPIGKLREMAAEGELTSDVVKNALLTNMDAVNEQFAQMPMTFEQIWTNFTSTALMAFQPVLERLKELANSQAMQTMVNNAITAVVFLSNVVLSIFDILGSVAMWVQSVWNILQPLIMGVGAAMLGYLAVLVVFNTIQGIANFLSGVHAAALMMQSGATFTATAAQHGLNAALLASPITWIILAVIALIAIIFAVVAAINNATGSSISALGVIFGAVAAFGAAIWNVIIGVLNAIIQAVWVIFVEPFITIVEWLLNVFGGGFDSFGDAVKSLLGSIISWFLSLGKIVTKIIDAIFGTDWTGGLNALQDNVLSWGKNEDAITLDRDAPTIDARIDYEDAYNAGYEVGENFEAAINEFDLSEFLGFTTEDDLIPQQPPGVNGEEYKGYTADDFNVVPYSELEIPKDDGKIKGGKLDSIGKIDDDVSITDEDIKMMRDVASTEFVNRFTKLSPNMHVTFGDVRETADVNKILATMEEMIEDAYATALVN